MQLDSCPVCDHKLPPRPTSTCPKCKASWHYPGFPVTCPACEGELEKGADRCPSCDQEMVAAAREIAELRADLRKQHGRGRLLKRLLFWGIVVGVVALARYCQTPSSVVQ